MKRKQYQGLTIGSGGYKGFGILGALASIDLDNRFDQTKIFAGCSVGGVITLLMACGWKPIELYKRAVNIKIFNGLSDINLEEFKKNYGLVSNENLKKELESLVIEKKGKLMTLLDFHNEGIYLSFSIADRITRKGYKLDYKSDPSLLASDASLYSANMPGIFAPVAFKGMEIVDGALSNSFPIDYIDNGEIDILAIGVYGVDTEDSGFLGYTADLFMIPIEENQRSQTSKASSKVDVLEMKVKELNYFSSGTTYKVKNKMFFRGYRDGYCLVQALNRVEGTATDLKPSKSLTSKKNDKGKKNKDKGRNSKSRLRKSPLNKISPSRSRVSSRSLLKTKSPIPSEVKISSDKPSVSDDKIKIQIKPGTSKISSVETEPVKGNEEINRIKSEYDHLTKKGVRIPIRKVPEPVLLKCLLSQPVDILAQIADQNPDLLSSVLEHLNDTKIQKLKTLARQLIKDELKSGIHIKIEEPAETKKPVDDDSISIKENHVGKLYDSLPPTAKGIARGIIGSMPEEKGKKVIKAVNVVLEGLSMLGMDMSKGLLITDVDSSFSSIRATPRADRSSSDGPIIEVMDDPDEIPRNIPRIKHNANVD